MRRRYSFVGLGLLFVWGFVAPAEAQTIEDRARAQELFQRGVAQARADDLEGAIDSFRQSYELYPLSGTLLNVGLYQLEAGHLIDARQSFQELLERYGEVISPQARQEVNRRLEALDAALAEVTVESRPSGAAVAVDGVERGETPLDDPVVLEPGEHRFEAALEGHEPTDLTRELSPGERLVLTLSLSPLPAPVAAPAPEPNIDQQVAEIIEQRPAERRGSFWRGAWPWIIGGALLLSGAGIALGIAIEDAPDPIAVFEVE